MSLITVAKYWPKSQINKMVMKNVNVTFVTNVLGLHNNSMKEMRYIRRLMGNCPWMSACNLVGMSYGLLAHDPRYSFQLCMQNMTCDTTRGSKRIDMPSGQLHGHCRIEGTVRRCPFALPFSTLYKFELVLQ